MIQIFGNFLERLFNNNVVGKTDVYGSFVDRPTEQEHLTLEFSPSKLALNKRWQNNSLSANFLADYLVTFFLEKEEDVLTFDRKDIIRNSVSYVANELLENAMKYCNETVNFPITLHAQIEGDYIRLFVDNSLLVSTSERYKSFIKEFTNTNPQEFYFAQLEVNSLEENSDSSKLGFVTIVNDYSAKLGWKFHIVEKNSPVLTVTTMAELSV